MTSGKKKNNKDNLLFYTVILLLIFGVVMVYDVSVVLAHEVFGGQYFFLFLQASWALLGLTSFFVISRVDYHLIAQKSIPVFFLSLLFLVFVLLPTPFSPEIYGARRWIYLNPSPLPTIPFIGRVSFQPSEFIKLTFILYMAVLLTKRKNPLATFLFVFCITVGLVLLQPDFGTALLISVIGTAMLFASGANLMYFVAGFPVAFVSALIFILTSDYRRSRLMTFLNQNSDPQGASYHINQILIALGSGGLFGLGFGQSRQKYQYIPEVATDSIFAIIGEELGFIGLLLVIAAFAIIIYRGFRIAKLAPDTLGKLVATGVSSWFGIQCLVNLGAMVHIIPLTGVPLPLISYGGSSMVFGLTALGILLNVSRHCKDI